MIVRMVGGALLLAMLLAMCRSGAWAQPLIEEIVVTATKRERGIYEVPVSLSVFVGRRLGVRGILDLVDVGKFVPNLNVTTFSAGHTSSANPFLRGIGTQDHLITTDPGVGVYVDGVYLGRQVGQHWNLANIERVEVLRGPQGTLYGRNSIGGAINIVTSRPGEDPGRRVQIRVGMRERFDAHFHADGHLSETLAATVSLGVNRRGGLGRFVNVPSTSVEVGQTRETFARTVLAWRASPNLSVTLAADANDGNNGLNPYTTRIDELPSGALHRAGYRNADVAANPYDNNTGAAEQVRVGNRARGLAVIADFRFREHASVRMIASGRRSQYEAGLDDDALVDDFLRFPEAGNADQDSLEVQFRRGVAGGDLLAGAYWFEEEGANVQDPTVFLGSVGRFTLDQAVQSAALFTNLDMPIGERWRFAGGLRRTRDEKQASTNVGTGLVSARRMWHETSWELSIQRELDTRMTAYAAIQSGYQSGQFPARPYCLFDDPDCFVAGDNITALNYELGLKGQPLARVELTASVFHTRYDNLPYQVNATAEQGFNTVNLIVKQRTTGVELEGVVHAGERFSLGAALGWLDVDLEKRQGVRPVAPLTPEFTAAVGPEYRRTLAGGGEIRARLDFSYRDRMFGEASADPGRMTRIGARSIVNFHLGYSARGDVWSLALYGRNAADARYDNARLNTGDYLLRILSNDASEFGARAEWRL